MEGVFGPFVFGVAGAEVFADFEVGAGPEAFKVGGDLHGFVAGGEEMEEDWEASEGYARRIGEAEKLL